MATEKQKAASRINGAKSKGPKTEEGKDASKRNSVKTGMYSMGFVLPEHLETEILDTISWIHEKVNPDNHIEQVLTEALAEHLVLFSESVRQQIYHKLKIAQRTLLCWDDDRKLAAAKVGDDLSKRPVAVALELSATKHGCVFLLDLWAQLGAVLDTMGDWTESQKELAYDLLGTHPVLRGPGGRLSVPQGAEARGTLRAVYDAEAARLAARRDGDLHEIDEAERNQALLGHLPDDPILNMYKRGGSRSLNAVLKIVKSMEVSLGRVGLAARLELPRRAVGESKSEFNDRWIEHREKVRKANDQARVVANAQRLRDIAEAAAAEQNVQPAFAPGMSIEAYIGKVREWHLRVHGEVHPMDLPPSLHAKLTEVVPPTATITGSDSRAAEPEAPTVETPQPPASQPARPRRNRKNQ